MAIVPPNIDPMLLAEVDFESPISEVLMNKLSANINALIVGKSIQVFTSSGTYTVPENVDTLLVFGCGGGGGGGSGGFTTGFVTENIAYGGSGGGGSVPLNATIRVTPLSVITATIGAGGAGGVGTTTTNSPGNAGGNTTFGGLTFFGAPGGQAGVTYGTGAPGVPGPPATASQFLPQLITGGGAGFRPQILANQPSETGFPGVSNNYASGGAVGFRPAGLPSGGMGGGGGAGLQNGGAGANAGTLSSGGIPGGNGGRGAGGGGGSGANNATNTKGGNGGNGGAGYLIVVSL